MASTVRIALPRVFLIFTLAAGALLWGGTARAGSLEYGATSGSFSTKYPTYYSTYGCSSCHTTAPTLNSTYGQAYKNAAVALGGRSQANMGPALTNIEQSDSDGDGYKNIAEITALRRAYDSTHFPTASVSLSTGQNTQAGGAGSTVGYSVTVTNNGNFMDSFTLGAAANSGQNWSPSIVGTANSVAAGGTAGITVNVAVSGGASAGQFSVARVTATSQGNTSITATPLDLTTTLLVIGPRYVNASTGNNTSNNCTNAGTPCRTITHAMSQAATGAPGDAINVAAGTYNTTLGEVFPITVKSGVQLQATGTAANTIVDATGANQRLFNASGSNASTLIQGFTITGGSAQFDGENSMGGAILMTSSEIKIRRNIFTGNEARVVPSGGFFNAYGGAIAGGGSPTIENNVFSNNTARSNDGTNYTNGTPGGDGGNAHGGAIWINGGVIVNNTFYGNVVRGGAGGSSNGPGGRGGSAFSGAIDGQDASVVNNIFVNNSAIAGAGGAGSPAGLSGTAFSGALGVSSSPSMTNNLFFGNTSNGDTGTNVILLDPQFVSPPSNLRIAFTSPARAAGTATGAPAIDFDGTARPTPPSIGAFDIAATRYVNAATGNNTSDCRTQTSPCKTITYAMAQATAGAPGNAINVAPGTYNVALGEVFPIILKSGVQLKATGIPASTIIDATGANQRVFNSTGGNSSTLIEGFTITGGFHQPAVGVGNAEGGAILINQLNGVGGGIKIRRNIFTGNEARGYSGVATGPSDGGYAYGGAISSSSSSPTIENNVFSSNTARGGDGANKIDGTPGGDGRDGRGGALSVCCDAAIIVNNTFYANVARGGAGGSSNTASGGSGGLAFTGGVNTQDASVVNNIFVNNSAIAGTGGAGSPAGSPGTAFAGALSASSSPSNTHNLFFGNSGNINSNDLGTNSILLDPQFVSPPTNLRIGLASPARGSGTATGAPAIDLDGTTRPNPPSRGAFEASGSLFVATDFNNDDKSDLLWRNVSTGQVYRMLMNGFTRTSEALVYTEANTAWSIIADADFNGDGVTDLLWRNSSTGQIYLLTFNSSGVPSAGQFIYTEANAAWKIIHTPDLDGDGKADLLWWNSTTGQVYGMLMNGFTIGTQGFIYTEPNTSWRIEVVGDFSGSGKANQLLWRNIVTGQTWMITVSVSGGGFTQTGQFFYQSTTPYRMIAAADFNGDGKSDLLWRKDDTGQVYMMIMNGTAITTEGQIYQEGNLNWKIVATGDYNGDGKADLLWRNETTGQVYMMHMNGMSIAAEAMIYQEPNTAWKILGPWEYRVP